jgi:hypothetical protein
MNQICDLTESSSIFTPIQDIQGAGVSLGSEAFRFFDQRRKEPCLTLDFGPINGRYTSGNASRIGVININVYST